ncbi:MAG: alpha/beta fold hydrolase [Phycisphaerales bacterium]|nr:alpha/beta fold hydrolase [Hyphomonadaceae bacterium]
MRVDSLKITFDGADGAPLAARLETPGPAPSAFALFAHCFTCGKDSSAAVRIARALAARDIAVLRFDFTGLGQSGGDFANTNFSSNIADLVAAAAYLRQQHKPPKVLIGHSLGGAAVIAAAHLLPEVCAVVTIGAPSDASHVAHHFARHTDEIEATGQAEVSLAGRTFTVKRQFVDDLKAQNQADRIARLKRALLVLHAPTDNVVGIDNAAQIFQAAKHPKSFVSLDGADHLLTRPADADYAAGIIAAWSARYVGADQGR